MDHSQETLRGEPDLKQAIEGDIKAADPLARSRTFSRRDFFKLTGKGVGALVAAKLFGGTNPKAANGEEWRQNKPLSQKQTDEVLWGSDIEPAKNLPEDILKSESFGDEVDKMRNGMASRGLMTSDYLAYPFFERADNDEIRVRFVVREKSTGDLFFFEKQGEVSKLKVPNEAVSLSWDFSSESVVGKNSSGSEVYRVEELQDPKGRAELNDKAYLNKFPGFFLNVVTTGEVYRTPILGKGEVKGELLVAKGIVQDNDGDIHGIDFIIGGVAGENEIPIRLDVDREIAKDGVIKYGIERNVLLRLGTVLDGYRQVIGSKNDEPTAEVLGSYYRDSIDLTRSHIVHGGFPSFYIFPSWSIEVQ